MVLLGPNSAHRLHQRTRFRPGHVRCRPELASLLLEELQCPFGLSKFLLRPGEPPVRVGQVFVVFRGPKVHAHGIAFRAASRSATFPWALTAAVSRVTSIRAASALCSALIIALWAALNRSRAWSRASGGSDGLTAPPS
jgi:hypothetical protein